jgi:amino acid transporter
MAEETKDPVRIFPKVMLTGLCITGVIYVLVAISAVALVSPADLTEGDAPLLKVVEAGAPAFPLTIFAFITMFAVANSALINMLMASRLLYGMAKQQVLPPVLGRVLQGRRTPWVAILFTTAIATGLLIFVGRSSNAGSQLSLLGGTTALLLLAVFTVVNICCLVLRKDRVEGKHFRAPTPLPIIGALCCAYLVGPWTGRATGQYTIAGLLIGIGVVLWGITWLLNRALYGHKTYLKNPEALEGSETHE